MKHWIAKTRSNGDVFVLIPQLHSGREKLSYVTIGWNWYDIKNKTYDSCKFYNTEEEAVESYRSINYEVIEMELRAAL